MNTIHKKFLCFMLSLIPISFIMYQAFSFLSIDTDMRDKIYVFMGSIVLSSLILAIFMKIAEPHSSSKSISPFELMWIVIFIIALFTVFVEAIFDFFGIIELYENSSGWGTFRGLLLLEITLAVAIPFLLILIGILAMTLRFISLASSRSVPNILSFLAFEVNNAIKSRHDYSQASKKGKF